MTSKIRRIRSDFYIQYQNHISKVSGYATSECGLEFGWVKEKKGYRVVLLCNGAMIGLAKSLSEVEDMIKKYAPLIKKEGIDVKYEYEEMLKKPKA